MLFLDDLWIFLNSGKLLVSINRRKDMDDQVFAMLMSAINTFLKLIKRASFWDFGVGGERFYILKVPINGKEVLFATRKHRETKHPRFLGELSDIAASFLKRHGKELDSWNGDVTVFGEFERECAKECSGKQKVGRMIAALFGERCCIS